MIGTLSGKIVNFSTRSKSCRVCTLNTKSTPPPHDCSINWHGSAKGMESDMIEEMVKDVNEGSVHVKAIVGDEDSTQFPDFGQILTQILAKYQMPIM